VVGDAPRSQRDLRRSALLIRGDGQRGYALIEALVALALTAVVFAAALALHDRLTASFRRSAEDAALQQSTRAAFDRLSADLRLAGFNIHPDGAGGRPEEAIEGMWERAVVLRADFDFEDPATGESPEATLGGASAPFRLVSTGNDEIVGYALGKPAGGGAGLGFVADVVGVPRDGAGETVTLTAVHTDESDPPYTLYRYTVSHGGASVSRQPVADDIRSLRIVYRDGAGAPLAPAGGADDGASRDLRRRIMYVQVGIVGMTEHPDLSWTDPGEPAGPARHHRKLVLEGVVALRNGGLTGAIDIPADPPAWPP
jgi:type II secretory pathway pseudopilin PulG